MPSRKSVSSRTKKSAATTKALESHLLFFPLVMLSLILWYLYRALFAFPVWFDESLGKAVFFGLPVWLYISVMGRGLIEKTFAPAKLQRGLLLGLAVGGVFGFVTALLALIKSGGSLQAVPLFISNKFWYEFGLAIFTGFWETLFFFSFIGSVILQKYAKAGLFKQLMLMTAIFVVFHAPNAFLRFNPASALAMLFLLVLFSLGQGLLFVGRRNGYALVLSHAIWGMALLVYGW